MLCTELGNHSASQKKNGRKSSNADSSSLVEKVVEPENNEEGNVILKFSYFSCDSAMP